MAGIFSRGAKLEVRQNTSGNNGTWIKVAGVTQVSGVGGGSSTIIDVSDFDSTAKEKLVGLPDEGSASVSLNYLPADNGQKKIEELRSASGVIDCKLTIPATPAVTFTFSGVVQSFEKSLGVDEKVTASVSIEISGSVVAGVVTP